MVQRLLFQVATPEQKSVGSAQERAGVVYTKRWVVDLILDLAGYDPALNLSERFAVEPAAGEGAFLLAMAERLLDSCDRRGLPIESVQNALCAFELDEESATTTKTAVLDFLVARGLSSDSAAELANKWVRVGDFLLDCVDLARRPDFVIGNPPYIRLEELDAGLSDLYRTGYPTMKGRADIYVAFYEAALRILAPDGVCAYICADRWMLNQYGGELRRFITSSFGVDYVIEMHRADAFDSEVSAYPAISVIRKGRPLSTVVAALEPGAEASGAPAISKCLQATMKGQSREAPDGIKAACLREWFHGDAPWPLIPPESLSLLARLEADFEPLENSNTRTVVGIGVATGADKVYITQDQFLVEPERLLPLAMASDAARDHFQWSRHLLVNPWTDDGLVSLSDWPILRDYFEKHLGALKQRNVGQRNPDRWFRTIDRVNLALTTKTKLYLPDFAARISPVLDRGETYPHHNLYFIRSDVWDHEVLGGLLLSNVAQFFISAYGVRMRGGYLRFQAQYLRRIRVPAPEAISEEQAVRLRQAFASRNLVDANDVAAEVYALSPGERSLLGH